MRILIVKTSDWDFREYRDINTLEELVALCDEFGHDLVIKKTAHPDATIDVEVYDDYRE